MNHLSSHWPTVVALLVICVVVTLWAIGLGGIGTRDNTAPPPNPPGGLGGTPLARHAPLRCVTRVDDRTGEVLGGQATGPGIAVSWSGTRQPGGAEPLDVLKLASERMSQLQQTPRASDRNARALIEVLEAIDELEGGQAVSAPVGPGFTMPPE